MKRGEIWTVSGGRDYASKPRPVVILQDDSFEATDSVTVCGLTTDLRDALIMRIPIPPTDENGLRSESRIMVDKIATVDRRKLGVRIGQLSPSDVLRINQAVLVFLGVAASSRAGREPH